MEKTKSLPLPHSRAAVKMHSKDQIHSFVNNFSQSFVIAFVMDATDVVVAVVFVSVAIAVKALPFTSSKKMQKVVE